MNVIHNDVFTSVHDKWVYWYGNQNIRILLNATIAQETTKTCLGTIKSCFYTMVPHIALCVRVHANGRTCLTNHFQFIWALSCPPFAIQSVDWNTVSGQWIPILRPVGVFNLVFFTCCKIKQPIYLNCLSVDGHLFVCTLNNNLGS